VSGVLLNIIDGGPAGEVDEETSDQSDNDADLSEVHCIPASRDHHRTTRQPLLAWLPPML
jgi:hypothetical protein